MQSPAVASDRMMVDLDYIALGRSHGEEFAERSLANANLDAVERLKWEERYRLNVLCQVANLVDEGASALDALLFIAASMTRFVELTEASRWPGTASIDDAIDLQRPKSHLDDSEMVMRAGRAHGLDAGGSARKMENF